MYLLTPEDQAAIRAHFIPKMKSMNETAWARWSMDQDGWQDDLEACMDPKAYEAMDESFEEDGEYPTKNVADFLAALEVEVYGHVVCE